MSAGRSMELAAAYAYCRSVAKREAKNFYYAFLALPKHKSDAMCAVYAFMRKADDLADDETMSIESRRAAMSAWKDSWRAARAAEAATPDPIFLALNDTQERFSISDDLLEHLVAGTTLDLEAHPEGVRSHSLPDGRTVQIYESVEALERYCYLVASVVGLVCIHIFGYIDPSAEQMAIDTGIAFQLTNILRDVKEDAERGRIYLPEDLLKTHEVTPERIIELAAGAAIRPNELALLRDVEQRAATLYGSGYTLVPLLDADARPSMRVLVGIYHRLLRHIAAKPAAVFKRRVSVSTGLKLGLLGIGLAQSFVARIRQPPRRR